MVSNRDNIIIMEALVKLQRDSLRAAVSGDLKVTGSRGPWVAALVTRSAAGVFVCLNTNVSKLCIVDVNQGSGRKQNSVYMVQMRYF